MIEFLSGDDKPIRRRLEEQMQEAAAEERFEDAARYRNRLRAIERLSERQAVERPELRRGRRDRRRRVDRARGVQLFPLREGRLVDRYSFHLENAAGEELGEVLEQFCLEYYGSAPSIPPQVLVPRGSGDTDALEAFLSERRGAHVEVRAPERGEKRRLQELAQQNAELALESETFVAETKRARRVEALEELREAAQPRVAADPDRVLRHLQHPGPGDRRLDGRVRGRASRSAATTASSRCAASTARTTSRRCAR